MDELAVLSSLARVFGISVLQLWRAIQKIRAEGLKRTEEERVAAFIDASHTFSSRGLAAKFTEQYYDDNTLQRAGLHRYTIIIGDKRVSSSLATFANWTGTAVPLGSKHEKCDLLERPREVPRPTNEEAASIFDDIRARKLKIWNAPIFRLLALDFPETDVRAQFCMDDFLRYRFTTGAIHDELIRALSETGFDIKALLDQRGILLPLRAKYLPANKDLSRFKDRITATGINVTTAIARPDPWNDYAIILQRRGGSVSSRQGGLTVLPSGHHQPTVEPEVEVAISRTVMRELFEEVFGGQEVQQDCRRLCVDWYESVSEPMKWLRRHRGAYDLILTGAGISLFTGSATISVALIIKDQSFWSDYACELRTNWEVSDQLSPILSTRDPSIPQRLARPDWTDYSFQSLAEGLLVLLRDDPERVFPGLSITRA